MNPERRTSLIAVPVGLLLGATIAGAAIYLPRPSPILPVPRSGEASQYFGFCFIGGGRNCVVDGDTFWNEGVKIRVADIDAPETHEPRCTSEYDLGRRATVRFQELLNQGPFTLETTDRDEDRYGRKLRIVMREGQSLGLRLVSEGLARPWTGSRQPWC